MTTEVTAEARHTGRAMRFVVLLGVVSLFADMTYEGARSVTGPFLATLGASAAVVGFVSGLGELVGYAVRLVSGYLSDRTGRYWTLTIVGYCVNLLAVPLLAWAGRWEVAVALIVAERFGKAVRTPPRDAMLSHAASRTGAGRAFGLHEALDQVGAVTGPLIVTAVLMVGGTHRTAFAILGIPAIVGISLVIAARLQYPVPRTMEVPDGGREERGGSLPPQFRLYLAGVALVAAGFADFPLMAYHFARTDAFAPQTIALVYSMAMAVDAAAALIWGRLYDRAGLRAMLIAVALSAAFAPLAFLGKGWLPLAGVALVGSGDGGSGVGHAGRHIAHGSGRPEGNGIRRVQQRLRGGLVRRQRDHGSALHPAPCAAGGFFRSRAASCAAVHPGLRAGRSRRESGERRRVIRVNLARLAASGLS